MKKLINYAYFAAKTLLKCIPIIILLMLLYTCFYIYLYAPDGGAMRDFKRTVAELLGHAISVLGLLFVAAAIPEVKIL